MGQRRMLLQTLEEYLVESSIHGLKYIANNSQHWTHRVFWGSSVALAWVACGFLVSSSWQAYQLQPVKFAVDTSYLHWNTSFPALSVCESENMRRVSDYALRNFGTAKNSRLNSVIESLVFRPANELSSSISRTCSRNPCPKENLSKLLDEIPSPCLDVFASCSWRQIAFSCCQEFLPLRTESGLCYTINSQQTKDARSTARKLHLMSNRKSGPGVLRIEIKTQVKMTVQIHVHAEGEVPLLDTGDYQTLTAPGRFLRQLVSVRETRQEAEVLRLEPSRRQCRLPEETQGDTVLYPAYSRSACVASCRAKKQRELCNCSSHHVSGNSGIECDLEGSICLRSKAPFWSILVPSWSDTKSGLYCPCLLPCHDMQIDTVHIESERLSTASNVSVYEITLSHLPSETDYRLVKNGQLNLFVSVGGVAGLLVGASVMSFVEILYFLLVRPWFKLSRSHSDSSSSKDVIPSVMTRRFCKRRRGNLTYHESCKKFRIDNTSLTWNCRDFYIV